MLGLKSALTAGWPDFFGSPLDLGKIFVRGPERRKKTQSLTAGPPAPTWQCPPFTNEGMSEADAVSILMASAAIPGFFPPRKVGENTYVDGGLVMNTPLRPAIDDGADEIHIVYLDRTSP
jgi:NTE family protein